MSWLPSLGQAVNELRFDNDAVDLAPVGFVLDEAANVPLVGLKEIAVWVVVAGLV